ncbi:MAG: DNA primase [Betaproteobacteria bacterium RIFCSPLOWO2_12_FULL_62_58]|nr:MAG: DNA primase [Betaproteobacteria bacterium RIFCSPLOWO2_12_FULL_62_58]
MIPQSFIQDLLNRVDIVDVVDRHVKLKRAGANYVACCPFHSEKTPSFTVSQTKQFYHCFGCGAHGTAVGFLMEYGGLGFVEAVKELAQSVGMKVPEVRSEPAQRRAEEGDDLYAVLLKAAQFYRAQLKDAPRAISYLKQRGLSGEIAKLFGIGYAPDGWQNLQAAFPNYNAKALVAAGLVIQGDEGKRYDRFRDRIMFPIVDVRGNVIAFGGRVLGEGEPKYLNSPETPVFEKGRELYGLYRSRRAIRDAGRVVVVEGYMDVVALAQHGVEYAVATLGTATTPLHVQKLLRQADEIVFCFDGDDAGRRAAWRALENSLNQLVDGKKLAFLFLPQGEDPDTYVRKLGKDAFEKLLVDAKPLSQFLLDELKSRVDLNTHEGRAKLLQDARPLVKQVAAPLLSLMLRKQLAELSGVTQQELDTQYQIKAQPRTQVPAKPPAPANLSLVQKLIARLMFNSEFAGLLDRREIEGFLDNVGVRVDAGELKALYRVLEALANDRNIRNFGEYFRDTEQERVFVSLEPVLFHLEEANLGKPELEEEILDGWKNLLLHAKNDADRRAQMSKPDAAAPAEPDGYSKALSNQPVAGTVVK